MGAGKSPAPKSGGSDATGRGERTSIDPVGDKDVGVSLLRGVAV